MPPADRMNGSGRSEVRELAITIPGESGVFDGLGSDTWEATILTKAPRGPAAFDEPWVAASWRMPPPAGTPVATTMTRTPTTPTSPLSARLTRSKREGFALVMALNRSLLV